MKQYIIQACEDEYFDWTFYYSEDEAISDKIWVGGNNDFIEINESLGTELFKCYSELCEDLENIASDLSEEDYIDEVEETIRSYLKRMIKDPTNAQILQTWKLTQLEADLYHQDLQTKWLEIIYGEPFSSKTLRGNGQSDWAECVYPTRLQNKIGYIESVFFALGAEFLFCPKVFDSDIETISANDFFYNNIDYSFTDYCPDCYSDIVIKRWAANTLEGYGISDPITDPDQQIVLI